MTAPVSTEAFGGIGVFGATVFAILGIPLQPVIWALLGGFFGSGLAKPASLPMAACAYLSASLISALIGHAVTIGMGWGPTAGNMMAALMSVGFHPALSWFLQKVPDLLNWLVSLLPGKGQR